jgi:hypothetical protein
MVIGKILGIGITHESAFHNVVDDRQQTLVTQAS